MAVINNRFKMMFASMVLVAAGFFWLNRPVAAQLDSSVKSPVIRSQVNTSALTYTTWLPLMANHDTSGPYGPWAVQMYDRLDASAGYDYAVAAGVRWMRLRVSWFDIEPTNTLPEFYQWETLDTNISNAVTAGVNLVVTLEGNPTWASAKPHGPVNNLADFQEFVGAMAARYPQVQYWEIYNEPDNIYNFGGQGAVYAAHLMAAYSAIKSANPQAQVVMGGIALDWFTDEGGSFDRNFLNDMLTACTGTCFDIGNFHYYPVYRANWEKYGRDIIGKAMGFRQMLAAHGYSRPVMSTETSWVVSPRPPTDWGGEAVQARYVPKTMIRSIAANLLMTSWYAMTDTDPDQPGLLDSAGNANQPRPSYYALVRLNEQLHAARYDRPLTFAETRSSYLEGYVFTDKVGTSSSERVDVIWYDCPGLVVGVGTLPTDCTSSASYFVNDTKIGVTDHLTGSLQILTDASDGVINGKIKLTVNRDPIYIRYNP